VGCRGFATGREWSMHARERIVRERFAEQTCTHCGARYPSDGVVVLARRRSTWMVMATCTQCQQRGLFVVSFPDAHHDFDHAQPHETLPAAQLDVPVDLPEIVSNSFLPAEPNSLDHPLANTPPLDQPGLMLPGKTPSPVTVNDVNEMHEFLAGFTGNFSTLFARIFPQSSDDSSS
jgi:hypothetical protein